MSNTALEKFKSRFAGKTALVIGLGRFGGGAGAIKFLSDICKKILVCEQKTPAEFKDVMKELSGFKNIEFKFGAHQQQDFENKDIIILNPSVMVSSNIYRWAKNSGASVFTEITLFFSLCKSKKIGITGTLGKSTLTMALYTVLKNSGKRCWVGGNIGGSLLSNLNEMSESDFVILELSSFQLQYFPQYNLSPYIGIILNIYPDHLDKHSGFDEYKNTKLNLIRYQTNNDFAILNQDAPEVAEFWKYTKAKVYFFSEKEYTQNGTFIEENNIYFCDNGKRENIFNLGLINNKFIHHSTILALTCCAKILNIGNEEIVRGLNSFKNLEHRMELVGEYNGRKFINDSNATTPQASIFGLDLIKGCKIVITGGKNKYIDYEPVCKKLATDSKAIFLIGETTPVFSTLIKRFNANATVYESANLQEAVISAYKISSQGDYIILSPATSSFDQFPNFVERGNAFKKVVKEIMDGKLQ